MVDSNSALLVEAREFVKANLGSSEFFAELNDAAFAQRMYAESPSKYAATLGRLDLKGLSLVLDAGSGYGQWALSLASLNENLIAVDSSRHRVGFLTQLVEHLGLDNVRVVQGSVTQLPPGVENLDAIFSYGVIFCTPWKETLREFFRVLKPGGFIIFTAVSATWFAYLWETEHNACEGYDPRRVVAEAFANSLNYANGDMDWSGQVVMSPIEVATYLEEIGYSDVLWAWEGGLGASSSNTESPGHPGSDGLRLSSRGIFEMKACKPVDS